MKPFQLIDNEPVEELNSMFKTLCEDEYFKKFINEFLLKNTDIINLALDKVIMIKESATNLETMSDEELNKLAIIASQNFTAVTSENYKLIVMRLQDKMVEDYTKFIQHIQVIDKWNIEKMITMPNLRNHVCEMLLFATYEIFDGICRKAIEE